MINSFDKLKETTRQKIEKSSAPKMALLPPFRGRTIEAIATAVSEGWVKPYFLGNKEDILKTIHSCDLNENDVEVIEVSDSDNCTIRAIELVETGEIDFIMSGDIIRKDLVDILVAKNSKFVKPGNLLSHLALLQTDRYHKLIFLTDAVVNCKMDATAKIKVTQNAAAVASQLGIESPKAALLAAVEAIYPAVPVTMEEAAIAKMSDRGMFKGVTIDGPLSFDVAISAEVARSKGIVNSKVAGETDIFVGPTIETANGVLKAMVMYIKAESASILTGGKCPVVAPFVIDSTEAIVNSVVLAAALSK